jgi:hypothetical protein
VTEFRQDGLSADIRRVWQSILALGYRNAKAA